MCLNTVLNVRTDYSRYGHLVGTNVSAVLERQPGWKGPELREEGLQCPHIGWSLGHPSVPKILGPI